MVKLFGGGQLRLKGDRQVPQRFGARRLHPHRNGIDERADHAIRVGESDGRPDTIEPNTTSLVRL